MKRRSDPQRGFTLTELLVACALLSTVSAAGLAAFARARATWQDATVEARLHERAQYAFATLEAELQMAGYFAGPAPAPLPAAAIPTSALACGLDVVRRLDRAIEVAPGYALACAVHAGGAAPGSAQLTLRRAAAHVSAAAAGRAQWWSLPLQPALGAVSWTGAAPPGIAADAAEVRDLLVRIYYIARQADGDAATPALRVKSLTSIAARPAFIDTEVLQGVESMQVELLPSSAAPRSLRLTLTIRADQADARAGRALRRLAVTRHFTLRNASHG